MKTSLAVKKNMAEKAGPGTAVAMAELLARMFGEQPDPYLHAVVGFDGRFKYHNSAWQRVLGLHCDELATRDALKMIFPELYKRPWEQVRSHLLEKKAGDFEGEIEDVRGRRRYFYWKIAPDQARKQFYVIGHEGHHFLQEKKILGSLLDAAAGIVDAKDVGDAIGAFLKNITRLAGWNYGELWVPSTDGVLLEFRGGYAADKTIQAAFEDMSEKFSFFKGDGLPGLAWKDGAAHALGAEDLCHVSHIGRAAQSHKLHVFGVHAYPIKNGSHVVAVAVFLSLFGRRWRKIFGCYSRRSRFAWGVLRPSLARRCKGEGVRGA